MSTGIIVTASSDAAPPPTNAATTTPVLSEQIDGVAWTFQPTFEDILRRTAAAAWCDPASQDWRCVKRNPARSVWRAEISGRVFYLKYYQIGGWRRRVKAAFGRAPHRAEWQAGQYALEHNIPAAPPAGFATPITVDGAQTALLVTEGIEPSWPLNEFWETLQTDADSTRRRADIAHVIDCVAELIARAHQAGFHHTDLHAENVLVQRIGPRRYRAVFVDLHAVRSDASVSDGAAMRNLAQLNQWFRKHMSITDRHRFLRRYLFWRNEHEHSYALGHALDYSFDELAKRVATAAEQHSHRLWAQRDRRMARHGRYFQRVRLGGGWRALVFTRCKRPNPESAVARQTLTAEWWRRALAEPGRRLNELGEPCKASHSANVRRVVLTNTDGAPVPLIIKQPLARSARRALRMLAPPSRSMRAWRLGNALLNRDIPTARPLAVVEQRWGPLVLNSAVLTELVPHSIDLQRYLTTELPQHGPRRQRQLKDELVRLVARQVRALERRGFVHRDCKAENMLLVTQPTLQILWIDLDGVRLRPRVTDVERRRAVSRLHVSLLEAPCVTRTDRVRFLKAYAAGFGERSDAWRGLWRVLEFMAAEKLRKKAIRRAWKIEHYGRA